MMFSPDSTFNSDSDGEYDSINDITVMLNSTPINEELLTVTQSNTLPKELFNCRLSHELVQFNMMDNYNADFSSGTSNSLYSCKNSNDLNTYINPLGNMQFLPGISSTTTYSIPTSHSVLPDITDDDTYLSKDRILQLLTSIPSLSEKITDLEKKNSTLESKYDILEAKYKDLEAKHNSLQAANTQLQSSFDSHCTASDKRFNSGEQYPRRNSFLLNKLRWVPRYRGVRFSQFIADQLTKLFPDYPVSLRDIDTSHVLYVDEANKPVVVVKFINRDLRNLLWDKRYLITDRNVFLTDHFTPFNKELFRKAKEAGHAWSDKCRIFARVNGTKKLIECEEDIVGIDKENNKAYSPPSQPHHPPSRPPRIRNTRLRNSNNTTHGNRRQKTRSQSFYARSYQPLPHDHVNITANNHYQNPYQQNFNESNYPKHNPPLSNYSNVHYTENANFNHAPGNANNSATHTAFPNNCNGLDNNNFNIYNANPSYTDFVRNTNYYAAQNWC